MADMGFWYHFGILFEALFILTALMRGTVPAALCCKIYCNFVPFLKTDSSGRGYHRYRRLRRFVGYLLYQGVSTRWAA